MGKFEVRLLGPFEVVVAGQPVEVPGAKRQALVACLALRAGRVVPTDTLVEALWGSELPAAPRNAVQHHVTRLRRALGDRHDPARRRRVRARRRSRGRHRVRGAARRCARALSAPVMRAEPRTRSPTRFPSGAALRCLVFLSRHGPRRRPGGWTRFGSMRWRSGSRRLSRWESTPKSASPSARRSRRARSASGCGGS